MADPVDVEGWLALVSQHEQAARKLSEDKKSARMGYFHAVMAVECALKAYIWYIERFNQPPDIKTRPDLFSHNLRLLKDKAGIKVKSTDAQAPSWLVILQADRSQYYDPAPMPRKTARAMADAAFGEKGVVTWIRTALTRRS
ncbi:hypothetical protein [Rhizobium rhizosphaerae]|uniref:hypothetical protein n=1 Tax=Xaviernesmea rhizosphaerae TaxID=1672749 RepID=UPI00117A25ED|nr:hypothetical protein [Xaviernesmea rhizosphaerae]